MNVPVTISFNHIEGTEELENLIREKAQKLQKVHSDISSCRITVEKPQSHISSGSPYRVRIDMTVPPSHELISKREPGQGEMHEDISTVIRDAFQAAERQLKKLKQQQRPQEHNKSHAEQQTIAIVSKLFKDEGYGFLQSANEDREIYFHKNSVLHNDFNTLEVGTGVTFEEEMGEKGPQATTVRVIDRPSM